MNIIINLNKDFGTTSHDATASVKRLFKAKKAGHAGTLDPIATGVLLICLNEATKIASLLSNIDKEYIVTARLGESTDTYDAEGKVVKQVRMSDLMFQTEDIEKVIKGFIGEIEQVPPMYSAIKVDGEPLYRLARKGIEIERKTRKVRINSIEILSFEAPFLKLKVSCSKGAYMRSLCNDIGNTLEVGAHMVELVRTAIGQFSIENSAKISELPHKTVSLCSIDAALRHLPEIRLEGDDLRRAKNGNPVVLRHPVVIGDERGFVRLKDPEGRIFGIGRVSKDLIKIERLLKL